MVADAVRWLCRSPRRLAVTIGGLVLLVVIGGAMLGNRSSGGPEAAGADPRPAATTAPEGATLPDAQPFVDAAVRFVAVWSTARQGETAAQWHRRVDPLVTPQLSAALAETDLAALPGSGPEGKPAVRYVAADSAMVAVPLANGSTVLVTVVTAARSVWLVSDVQPDMGDFGDTGSVVPTKEASATPGATPRATRGTAGDG